MKKVFAVICLLLLMVQAVPVITVLAADNIQISWLDEDKPQDPKLKEVKNVKEFLKTEHFFPEQVMLQSNIIANHRTALPSPFLDYFAPPPNFA